MDEEIAIVGCGFIGSSLAEHLSSKYSVVTLDINPLPKRLEGCGVIHRICDVRDFEKLAQSIGNPSVVIHTAIIQIPRINEEKRLGYEVNVLGTQNVCEIVAKNPNIRGLILTGSWHVWGEEGLEGRIAEDFGYRPDRVGKRAKLYAISKILQECVVRFYDEMVENKFFSVIRLGTVLGEFMPEKTAANLFITGAIREGKITPFKHSMYRPMLYVAIEDVCKVFESYIKMILEKEKDSTDSLWNLINLVYPKPITILELAEIVKDAVMKYSDGKIQPEITIVDKGIPPLYSPQDKDKMVVDVSKLEKFLKVEEMITPKQAIEKLVEKRLRNNES